MDKKNVQNPKAKILLTEKKIDTMFEIYGVKLKHKFFIYDDKIFIIFCEKYLEFFSVNILC